ncbi:MAG: class I SAM-dependent methyltransferase [Anaerolineae bacterium]|nr:class I SAM-dependent methyltransferase [Anaerolineae bacterium]
MYGPEASDPVVRYYDEVFAVTASNDIAWFVDQARSGGGRVLDLACGTGRIAIALAHAGLNVTAIDDSEGMLKIFRSKLSAEPQPIQTRIRIQQARMQSFELADRFSSVVCCDAFFHNLAVADQMSSLHAVARHLLPGGIFAFNIPNPTIGFLSHAASEEGKVYQRRGEYTLGDCGDTILVEQAHEADLVAQIITTRLRFTRLNAEHETLDITTSSWVSRFTYRYEAEHLLYRCGFEMASLSGDYRRGPVMEESQLIFVARRLIMAT